MKPIRIAFDFYQRLPKNLNQQLETFLLADKEFWTGCSSIAFPRYGKTKIWNFHHDNDYLLCPALHSSYQKTFDEVTDLRAAEVKEIMLNRNQELAVFWSGGIDSTVILSAIAKHFSPAELKNVVVFANDQSYFENPTFYHSVIEKYQLRTENFKNFSNHKIQSLFDNYLIVDGEPADKLWIVNIALQFESTYGTGLLKRPLNEMTDLFIKFVSNYMTARQAREYYDFLVQNIKESDVEIQTLGDLFWWINFNFHWVEHLLIWYHQFPDKSAESYKQYKKNYLPWYNTNEYQLWSLSDRPKAIETDRLDLYKMPAKKYIFELSKDLFYLNYKSKVGSPKDLSSTDDLVLLDDGTRLDCSNQVLLEQFIRENCLVY